MATLEFIFAAISVYSAKSCFDNAAAIVSAKATVGSTTNPSTDNKQTATEASGNNSPSDNVKTNASGKNKGGGAARAAKYRDGWQKGSLKEAIQKIAPNSEGYISENGQKIIFENNTTNKRVVYDIEGNYFRIEDMNISGKRCYTDIDGNPIPNNITNENGTQRGLTQDEYNKMTHFK